MPDLLLLPLFLLVVTVVLPIWSFAKVRGIARRFDEVWDELVRMRARVTGCRETVMRLEAELKGLGAELASLRASRGAQGAGVQPDVSPAGGEIPAMGTGAVVLPAIAAGPEVAAGGSALAADLGVAGAMEAGVPPVVRDFAPAAGADEVKERQVGHGGGRAPGWLENVNWEQFMGVRLFAWLGGLALFLGVAFFVKYSFEHNLIPPAVRVAMGFVFGTGLVVGGMRMSGVDYRVTSQTLIAAGVVSLYAVSYACGPGFYSLLGVVPVFLLMTLITVAAFALAVRLEAQVVAVLGILGGFLTPVLVSSGVDNPAGLFGYLALLNLGLVAVALHRSWLYLMPLGAGATVLMMIAWAAAMFRPEKAPVLVTVSLLFSAIFLGAYVAARRLGRATPVVLRTTVAMSGVALAFALALMGDATVSARPGLLFTFILMADVMLLAVAWFDERLPALHWNAGLAVFGLLFVWMGGHLTGRLLPWAMAVCLLYAALHVVFPIVLERRRPSSTPTFWSQLFPPLALLLMLVPLFKLDTVPLVLWPAILLVDVMAVLLAALTASVLSLGAALFLTLAATAVSVFRIPLDAPLEPSLLVILAVFALFFFGASLWLMRRLGDRMAVLEDVPWLGSVLGDARLQMPALSLMLPFLLLIMVCNRLALPSPSAVFGLGLLLVMLMLGLGRMFAIEWLPACALAGMAAVEFAWHSRHFSTKSPGLPLAWHVFLYALFAISPFLFRREFRRMTGPWAVAALSGPLHFWMVYHAVKTGWPRGFGQCLGIVPALFALAPAASLFSLVKDNQPENPKRLNQLAWFGGVTLFFVTLVLPVQFERQWLTVAWALEGVALLWLFHRVPHPGLRATGVALLALVFVRLALNPAVLSYHARSGMPIFNWYLYTYGIAIASLFAGARLLAPPRDRVLGVAVLPWLFTLGTILAFLLLNIEIADFFTPPGMATLIFQVSGNFARDMCYTIGWALFAFGLLAAGIWKHARTVRYAAISLLCVVLVKLFFHDLARLEAFYRIGALFAVAAVAMLASLAYQRFLPVHEKATPFRCENR